MKEGEVVDFSKYYELAEDDYDFLLLLLNQTYLDYSNTVERYQVLVNERDLVNLTRLIHKIKPTLVMFELVALEAKIAHHKNVLLQNGHEDDINTLTNQIVADLEHVLVEISEKCLEIKSIIV